MSDTKYNHRTIEKKWQKRWDDKKLYEVKEDQSIPDKKHRYILDMFPYPSGAGLHVGHPEGYTATDIYSRYLRMRGYSVLHPMGWDSFGLPAENYAIKQGIHPRKSTLNNIDNFRRQIKSLGFSYDWSREISTCDPEYYKWTQWFFLLLYKHGLAYKKKAPVNWCQSCKTVLAREQVIDGKCERCKSQVVQKELKQWFFKITAYAERLLDDLDKIDWPEPIKLMQENWIGRSEGAEITFPVIRETGAAKMSVNNIAPLLHCSIVEDSDNNRTINNIKVFTTRPDTIFGATYMVVAPEHSLITNYQLLITNYKEVKKYIEQSKKKTELERTDLVKEKTGVELKGIKAINPATGEAIPIWVADYVVMSYGTGAIMAVPAHDTRDWEFAKKYYLPIRHVIKSFLRERSQNKESYLPWIGQGILINSQPKNPEKNSGNFVESANIVLTNCPRQGCSSIIEDSKKIVKSKNDVAPAPGFASGDSSLSRASQHYATDSIATSEALYQNTNHSVKISFNGMSSENAKVKIVEWLAKKGLAKKSVQYKLRDWLISRQRYWGAPIPIIYCPKCGEVQEDFLKNIKWLLEKVNKSNFETIKASRAVGKFSQNVKRLLNSQSDLVYLNSYVLGKLRGWFRKFKGHTELPLAFYFLLPRVVYVPSVVYQDHCKPQVYHFALHLPRHNFNVVIDIERVRGRNEITTLFIARDRYLKRMTVLKKESSRGPATSPSCLPNLKARNGGSGISTLCKNSYQYYKCFGKRSQEILYQKTFKLIPVPEDQLPIELPDDVDFKPGGQSPLEKSKSFHNVKCPQCGSRKARRESDTMDTFMCSSWYYLRYTDPRNSSQFACKDKIKYWLPVDVYVGGAEHAVMHLLYARFFCKILYDLGYIDFDEPFVKLINQGLILAEDGRKMSKSLGNVINPDDVVKKYGADCLRMYEMFMGPLEDAKPWSTDGIRGIRRFLEKVWQLFQSQKSNFKSQKYRLKVKNTGLERLLHKTIKKVTEDIENFKFNTAISQLMILANQMSKCDQLSKANCQILIVLLAPFAPHLAEELWKKLGHKDSIFKQEWPKYHAVLAHDSKLTIVIQVNGRLRDQIELKSSLTQEEVVKRAKNRPKIQKWIGGRKIKKEIYVPNRLVNFVV